MVLSHVAEADQKWFTDGLKLETFNLALNRPENQLARTRW